MPAEHPDLAWEEVVPAALPVFIALVEVERGGMSHHATLAIESVTVKFRGSVEA